MGIVEWLREAAKEHNMHRCEQAADDIDRMQEWSDNAQEKIGVLEGEIERLREALQHMLRWHDQLSASDIAKAEAALQQKESE